MPQNFTLARPTSFHRFIRLDFLSYYGTEFYCPVSQIKVFGLNQMEAYKRDQKLVAADAKERERERIAGREREDIAGLQRLESVRQDRLEEEKRRVAELETLEMLLQQEALRIGQDLPGMLTEAGLVPPTATALADHNTSSSSGYQTLSEVAKDNPEPQSHNHQPNTPTDTGTGVAESRSRASEMPILNLRPTARSDPAESIYAFIVRRLNALEGNSSLVARYIEEQSKVTRLQLSRVERTGEQWRIEWENDEYNRWQQEASFRSQDEC